MGNLAKTFIKVRNAQNLAGKQRSGMKKTGFHISFEMFIATFLYSFYGQKLEQKQKKKLENSFGKYVIPNST